MVKDSYANRFAVGITESSAGTPRYSEVPTYASAFEKVAFLLHKVEYFFSRGSYDLLVAAADEMIAGITTTNLPTNLTSDDAFLNPGIIDIVRVHTNLRGTAANLFLEESPIVHDFTSLPGGGLIMPARPIYVAVQGLALAAVATVYVRGFFTRIELKADEWIELVDAYRMIA